MKVRPTVGGCYYIDEFPDENGEYHGANKYTDADARLRWTGTEWVVVWEGPLQIEDWR